MHITANFDSGNIQVISSDNADNIRLAIKKDHQSDFYQWFHFKLFADCLLYTSDAADE